MGIRLVLLISIMILALVTDCMAVTNNCLRCHENCHGIVYAQHHAVPVAEFSCVDCHRGNSLTQRRELAHYRIIGADYAWYRYADSKVVKAGEKRVDTLACRRCHVLAAKGNNLATNLDRLYPQGVPRELVEAIRVPAFFMPDFSLSHADSVTVVNVIFAAGVATKQATLEPPLVIHFESSSAEENLFDKHCGRCHRVLTAQHGGIGVGDVGPNLSDLLGEFYPKTYKDDQPWTVDGLKKWIKNPRSVRPLTRMMPVVIGDEDTMKLINETWPLKVKE